MRKRAGLLLLAFVALAGCSGLQSTDSAVPTGQEAQEGYAAFASVEGTVEYQYQSPETASNTSLRVVQRPKQQMTRQEFLSPSTLAGDRTVSNVSVSWFYDASENTATRISIEGISFSNTSNAVFVRRVFSNITESDESAIVTNPPLPVGPLSTGSDGPELTSADLAGPTQFTVEYLGTKTVADRRTHGVTLDPVNETGTSLSSHIENATYWFDAEYFFPLETTTVISIDGDVTQNTRLYSNVSFNPEVTGDQFQFDPPAGATVRTPPETRTATFDTAAGAAANVSFGVTVPDVPAEFDLDAARVSRVQNRTTVLLRYADETDDVTISTRDPPLDSDLDGETVSIGSVNATVTSLSDTTALRWQCDGLEYTVRGTLSRAEIRTLARDLATSCSV